ncbi:GNAT family N-acetyltransferase [Salininema proteolyticum]|uniref:GNAT family N-acetyltransferase n=1 Tax=Salininema proteolyticum TaxID=1607685 RepID=A0ABV8U5W9_9ACTN
MKPFLPRRAVESDLEALFALRREATAWLAESGVDQWPPRMYEYAKADIGSHVRSGGTYLFATTEGELAGTVSFGGPDRDYWQESDGLEHGAFVYKMIVARAWAGIGLGEAILDWACDRAQAEGRTWVGLDCRRDNKRLHRYYTARGFDPVRLAPAVEGRYSGALFRRPVEWRSRRESVSITPQRNGGVPRTDVR